MAMGPPQEAVIGGPTRRNLLAHGAARAAAPPDGPAFDAGTVGVFGLDWLLDARLMQLLDTMAASPGEVRGVQVFGPLGGGRDNTNGPLL